MSDSAHATRALEASTALDAVVIPRCGDPFVVQLMVRLEIEI